MPDWFASQQVDYVDPEILACGLCGLHIDHFHLSQDRLTLGMTAFKEVEVEVYTDSGQPFLYYLDGRTLLIETDLKDDPAQCGRYHFTTAHETAHQILANLYPTDRVIQNRIIYYRGHSPQYPVHDWGSYVIFEANRPASMMPSGAGPDQPPQSYDNVGT